MRKILIKIIAICLSLIMLFSMASCAKQSEEERFSEFLNVAIKGIEIPGCDIGFVPQGICYDNITDTYLISGYMSDDTISPLYVIDNKTEKVKKITLSNSDGSDYMGHAGGVATDGKNVWISSGSKVRQTSLTKILEASDGAQVGIEVEFPSFNNASFIFSDDTHLYVGEFFETFSYKTDKEHKLKTPSGETHRAIVCAFEIDSNSNGGVKSKTPTKVLSIREKVQGFAVLNGEIICATSYGSKNDSQLFYYEDVTKQPADSTFKIDGNDVPLWYVDNDSLKTTLNCPPMVEGIDVVDNKICILFESNSTKYRDKAPYPQKNVCLVG